jgi:hypothetical protein
MRSATSAMYGAWLTISNEAFCMRRLPRCQPHGS